MMPGSLQKACCSGVRWEKTSSGSRGASAMFGPGTKASPTGVAWYHGYQDGRRGGYLHHSFPSLLRGGEFLRAFLGIRGVLFLRTFLPHGVIKSSMASAIMASAPLLFCHTCLRLPLSRGIDLRTSFSLLPFLRARIGGRGERKRERSQSSQPYKYPPLFVFSNFFSQGSLRGASVSLILPATEG